MFVPAEMGIVQFHEIPICRQTGQVICLSWGKVGVFFMTFKLSTFNSEAVAICPLHAMYGRWHCMILLPKYLCNYKIQNEVICMAGCKYIY